MKILKDLFGNFFLCLGTLSFLDQMILGTDDINENMLISAALSIVIEVSRLFRGHLMLKEIERVYGKGIMDKEEDNKDKE